MDKLPQDARALLEAARTADNPTREERARADSAVRAALSAYGVDLPALTPELTAPNSAEAGGAGHAAGGGGLALKVGAGALAICAAAWLGVRAVAPAPASPSPPVSVVVPAAPMVQTSAAVVTLPTTRVPAVAAVEPQTVQARTATAEPARSRPSSRASGGARVDDEVRMISRANALVAAQRFDAALRVLAQHAAHFPNGILREERRALRVLSLCGQGPSANALRERTRFLQSAPESVLAARVSTACAQGGAGEP